MDILQGFEALAKEWETREQIYGRAVLDGCATELRAILSAPAPVSQGEDESPSWHCLDCDWVGYSPKQHMRQSKANHRTVIDAEEQRAVDTEGPGLREKIMRRALRWGAEQRVTTSRVLGEEIIALISEHDAALARVEGKKE
jgi:hypothetical protein